MESTLDRLLSAVPWPDAPIWWTVGFICGVVGHHGYISRKARVSRNRSAPDMSPLSRYKAPDDPSDDRPFTRSERRRILLGVFVSLVVGLGATIIGTLSSIENGRQNAARDADISARTAEQNRFAQCLDDYAGKDSTRADILGDVASKTRDATLEFISDFAAAFTYALSQEPGSEPDAKTVQLVIDLTDSASKYAAALAEQSKVSNENPPPDKPSVTCALTPSINEPAETGANAPTPSPG